MLISVQAPINRVKAMSLLRKLFNCTATDASAMLNTLLTSPAMDCAVYVPDSEIDQYTDAGLTIAHQWEHNPYIYNAHRAENEYRAVITALDEAIATEDPAKMLAVLKDHRARFDSGYWMRLGHPKG